MTASEKHLKILSEITGMSVAILTNYLSIGTNHCLSAMAVLQTEIDELRRENETLRKYADKYKLHCLPRK